LNQRKIPALSVSVSGGILMLGVALNYLIPDQVFSYALTMVAWLILGAWSIIALAHLFYRRAASREMITRVGYRLPGAPYTNLLIILVIGVIGVLLALHGGSRITLYILLSWFGCLTVAYYALHVPSQSVQKAVE
jgi:AAT family amino acid transporter/D-serine/D-alanine/glycine transporter